MKFRSLVFGVSRSCHPARPAPDATPVRPVPFQRGLASLLSGLLVAGAAILSAEGQNGSPAGPKPGLVCHVKVLSDKIEDVSSLESWKKSFIKEGMTDEQKAKAVWETVVRYQHQDSPPAEYLQQEDLVLDPLKIIHVYGYSFCSVASSGVQALARYAGLPARGWTIRAHVVPEVFWGDSWHLLDASLINYFPKSDGQLASVSEISAAVKAWYETHPEFRNNERKLVELMRSGGWTGWKAGPELLNLCPYYGATGWLPAATHGWYSTMQEYDGSTLFDYESGYSLGYQVNVQLRRGERLTRNWFNRGLHVNMDGSGPPGCLTAIVGEGSLRYTPKYGDRAPGRVGNGRLEYDVPLGNGEFRSGALRAENISAKAEDRQSPEVHVKDPAQPGVLEFRMPSSYVYLTGELNFKGVAGPQGRIEVLLSDNHGLDWKEVATFHTSGEHRIDLTRWVLRRYDYRIRFLLRGPGTGLDALNFAHDIQHSQRPLPALDPGDNTISLVAGAPESTLTLEGKTSLENRGKQLVFTDFHPESQGLAPESMRLAESPGQITFPVATPGNLVRLRIGLFCRLRDARDSWETQVSFDGGKTFRTVQKLQGPAKFLGNYTIVPEVPDGTKAALVRFAGKQVNTTMIFNFRIDADYRETYGGFLPLKATYLWEEEGKEKRHEHVATTPEESYTVHCEGKPLMKSLIVEVAP